MKKVTFEKVGIQLVMNINSNHRKKGSAELYCTPLI